jgi:hypothetical protein
MTNHATVDLQRLEQFIALFASRIARAGVATLVQAWAPATDASGWQYLATSGLPYAIMGTGDRTCTIRSINAAQCLPLSPSGASVIAKSFANGQSMYHGDLFDLPLSGRCLAIQEAARQGVRTALVFPLWNDLHGKAQASTSPKPMAVLQVLITAAHIPATSLIEVASISSTLVGFSTFFTPPTPWPLFLPTLSDGKAVITSVPHAYLPREPFFAKGRVMEDATQVERPENSGKPNAMGPANQLKAQILLDTSDDTHVMAVGKDKDNCGCDTSGEDGDQKDRDRDKDSDAGSGGDSAEENHHAFYPGTALTMQDIQAQFGVGLRQAALNLGLSMTTLKRCCRKYGITRWPRRELVKLKRALDSVGAVGALGSQQVAASLPAEAQKAPRKNQHDGDASQDEDKLSRKERDAMNMLFALQGDSSYSDPNDAALEMEEGRKRVKTQNL